MPPHFSFGENARPGIRADRCAALPSADGVPAPSSYGRTSRDPADYTVTGFPAPADSEAGPSPGFSLSESELGLTASIDPWLRGAAHIALGADNSVSVEEAYVQTTSLGSGLSLKDGRFFSGIAT